MQAASVLGGYELTIPSKVCHHGEISKFLTQNRPCLSCSAQHIDEMLVGTAVPLFYVCGGLTAVILSSLLADKRQDQSWHNP